MAGTSSIPPRTQSVSEDMIKRAGDAGLRTLVFTVDVPEGSNPRAQHAQWLGPAAQLTWRTKFEALRHPAWMMEWMKHGTPYSTTGPICRARCHGGEGGRSRGYQNRAPMTWKHVERYPRSLEGQFRC